MPCVNESSQGPLGASGRAMGIHLAKPPPVDRCCNYLIGCGTRSHRRAFNTSSCDPASSESPVIR